MKTARCKNVNKVDRINKSTWNVVIDGDDQTLDTSLLVKLFNNNLEYKFSNQAYITISKEILPHSIVIISLTYKRIKIRVDGLHKKIATNANYIYYVKNGEIKSMKLLDDDAMRWYTKHKKDIVFSCDVDWPLIKSLSEDTEI